MRQRHSRDEILRGALDAVLDDGLSRLTFGRLAARLGISDRMIVYYFPSKDDLVGEVLVALGAQLEDALAPAISRPVGDHVALVRAAWPVLALSESDAIFALFFEAAGLAAAGLEPYATIVPQLVGAWLDWAAALITGPPARRRSEAAAAIATIDGLLLLRQLAGAEAADQAVKRIAARPAR